MAKIEKAMSPHRLRYTLATHLVKAGVGIVTIRICSSATRHRLNPWSYLRDVLDQLAGRSVGDDMGGFLPDAWATRHGRTTDIWSFP